MDRFKRQVKMVKNIAIDSIMIDIANGPTLTLAAGVGLIQGLKYNGNLKRGVKAGLATMCVISGVNVVRNVANNWHVIKNQ